MNSDGVKRKKPGKSRTPSISPVQGSLGAPKKRPSVMILSEAKASSSSLFTPMGGRIKTDGFSVGDPLLLKDECNRLISNGKEIENDTDFKNICNQFNIYSVEELDNLIVDLASVRGGSSRAKYNYLLSSITNECIKRKELVENKIRANSKHVEPLNILENFSEHKLVIKNLTPKKSEEKKEEYSKAKQEYNKLELLKTYYSGRGAISARNFSLSERERLTFLTNYLNKNRILNLICENYSFFSHILEDEIRSNYINVFRESIQKEIEKDSEFIQLNTMLEMTRNNIIENSKKADDCGYGFYDLHGLRTIGNPIRNVKYILQKIIEAEGENSYFQLCPGNTHGEEGLNTAFQMALSQIEELNKNVSHYKPGKRIVKFPSLGHSEKSELAHLDYSIRYGIAKLKTFREEKYGEENDAVILVKKGDPSPLLVEFTTK